MKNMTQIPLRALVKLEKVFQDRCGVIAGRSVLSRGRENGVCGCMVIHVCMCVFLKVHFHLSGCVLGVSITSHQQQPHFSLSAFSLPQSNAFTLLPKHRDSGCGMYASAARNSHCIFRHFLKNKGCFVGAPFS